MALTLEIQVLTDEKMPYCPLQAEEMHGLPLKTITRTAVFEHQAVLEAVRAPVRKIPKPRGQMRPRQFGPNEKELWRHQNWIQHKFLNLIFISFYFTFITIVFMYPPSLLDNFQPKVLHCFLCTEYTLDQYTFAK